MTQTKHTSTSWCVLLVTPKTLLSNLITLGRGFEGRKLGWNKEVLSFLGGCEEEDRKQKPRIRTDAKSCPSTGVRGGREEGTGGLAPYWASRRATVTGPIAQVYLDWLDGQWRVADGCGYWCAAADGTARIDVRGSAVVCAITIDAAVEKAREAEAAAMRAAGFR